MLITSDPLTVCEPLGSPVSAEALSSKQGEESPEPKYYGVYRHVSKAGSLAWRVSLARRGRAFARTFSVKRYGSDGAALQAALAYRDELIKQHPMVSRRENHAILRANSHSGIPGVRLDDARNPPRWIASIELAGQKPVAKFFRIDKYGYEQAFELAVQARKLMLDMVVDQKTIRAPGDPVVLALAPERVVTEVVVPLTSDFKAPERNHSSGVPGVFRFMHRKKRPDGSIWEVPMWGAEYRWPDKAKLRRIYATSRFGDDGARQMALAQHAAWQQNPPAKPVKGAARKGPNGSRKPICTVQRTVQPSRSRSGGPERVYWQVIYRFPDDGQQRSATFSVALYGEDGAYQRAAERRQQWEQIPPPKLWPTP